MLVERYNYSIWYIEHPNISTLLTVC